MTDNPVLTREQARAVTRGRTPLVPVEYEDAVRALVACTTLDETKYWSNKADALAAWARMYRDDVTLRKAKCLKLHAYRRMGQLAAELRGPHVRKTGVGVGKGSLPGARALLEDSGLTTAQTSAARSLAALPEAKFNRLLKSPNPISPTTARYMLSDDGRPWHDLQRASTSLRSVLRRHTPAQMISCMTDLERETGETHVTELSEWLDEFAQRLAKARK